MKKFNSTQFVIVTGGIDQNLDSEILKSTQLQNALFKNHTVTVIKVDYSKEFEPAVILVEHTLDEKEWHKNIARKHFKKFQEKFKNKKPTKKDLIEDIKKQIKKIAELKQPDYLLIEVKNNISDVKALDLIEAIHELEKELGRKKFLFVHIENMPNVNLTEAKIEKSRGQQFLDITGTKPNAIVKGLDIIWME